MQLTRYIDGSGARLATLKLASGERILLSLVKSGLTIHRLLFGGYVPGRRVFAAGAPEVARMQRVLAREPNLPPLPRASGRHDDQGAIDSLLDAALKDMAALNEGRAVPGAVDALDTEAPRPLALFTRLALTCEDTAACARRFERVRNTPG